MIAILMVCGLKVLDSMLLRTNGVGGDNVRLDHTRSVASARRTSGPGNQNQETMLSYPLKRLHDGEPTIIFADFCSA